MKKDIHPNFLDMEIHCACGHSHKTKSFAKKLDVEICSKCHPFFAGKRRIIDTLGQVEKFNKRYRTLK